MSATLLDAAQKQAAAPSFDFEPVNVEARFDNPRAAIDADRSKNWFKRVFPILWVNKWAFSIGITMTILTMLVSVALPALSGQIIDALPNAITEKQPDHFLFLVIVMMSLTALRFIFGFLGTYQMSRVSNQLEADLRSVIYNHLVTLSFSFYDNIQTGQVISRANSDIKAIQMFLMMSPMLLTSVLSFIFAAVYMLSVSFFFKIWSYIKT